MGRSAEQLDVRADGGGGAAAKQVFVKFGGMSSLTKNEILPGTTIQQYGANRCKIKSKRSMINVIYVKFPENFIFLKSDLRKSERGVFKCTNRPVTYGGHLFFQRYTAHFIYILFSLCFTLSERYVTLCVRVVNKVPPPCCLTLSGLEQVPDDVFGR